MVVVLWQNWGEHVGRQLPHFLARAALTDVSITVGPRSVKAHRIILAFFSPFFRKMFEDVSEERPMVVVFPGVNFDALQLIVAYMYRGQVNVPGELLPHVIELAKMLKVKGLIELPAQLDTVLAGSGSQTNATIQSVVEEEPLDLQQESEGLVEFEVTADESESPMNMSSSSKTHTPIAVVSSRAHLQPSAALHIHNVDAEDKASREDVRRPPDDDEDQIMIEPDDMKLSTVGDLAHTQIVKLSDGESMGEMLLSGDYIPGERSTEEQPDEMYMQANPESVQKKVRKKFVCKLPKYRPEDLQRAVEDVRGGAGTLREIAERWGVPHSTLSVNARMAGISIQQRNSDYDNQTLEAAKQAVKAGSSYMKVAREYNIPKSVLWRRCQREGVVRGEARRCYNYSQEDITIARTMLLTGRSLTNIVKDTKIPKTTLFRLKEQLVREGKMPASSISRVVRPRRPSELSLQQAVAACKEEGMSQCRASEKFQVSKTTVWRRLRKLKQDPDHNYKSITNDPQNVKIEVVEQFADEALGDSYDREITMRYTEDGDLQYVEDQTPQDKSLNSPSLLKYPTLRTNEKQEKRQNSSKKHGPFEVLPESELVQEEGETLVIGRSQESFIDGKHLGIFSDGQVISSIAQEGKEGDEGEEERDMTGSARFELEMPLMNLPGGGYQVVGSEIVIGGQQVVVLEPPASTSADPAGHHIVTNVLFQEGLEDLPKVEALRRDHNKGDQTKKTQ